MILLLRVSFDFHFQIAIDTARGPVVPNGNTHMKILWIHVSLFMNMFVGVICDDKLVDACNMQEVRGKSLHQ